MRGEGGGGGGVRQGEQGNDEPTELESPKALKEPTFSKLVLSK